MGIPDIRPPNYWGFYFLDQQSNWSWQRQDWDGSWVSFGPYTYNQRLFGSMRRLPSSNPVIPVQPGKAACWRSPSSYERSISTYQQLRRGSYATRAGFSPAMKYQEDCSFNNLNSVVKSRPEFWRYGIFDPEVAMSVNKRARLITECLLKVKGQKMSLGATLAEAVKTYSMFAQKAETFFKSLHAAKRGNWRQAFREIGVSYDIRKRPSASGVYLEYTYGIAPLLGEIYGGYELLKERLEPTLFVHAVRKLSKSVSETYVKDAVSQAKRWTISENFRGWDKLSLTGAVSDNYARDIARAGMSNPAAIAWEVTPWSFLIDWGMPIGNCLEAMDATYGLDFVGGYFASRAEGTIVGSTELREYSDPNLWTTLEPSMGIVFIFSNWRQKVTSWPWPQVYAKSPFSTKHAANALALFRQLNRRY